MDDNSALRRETFIATKKVELSARMVVGQRKITAVEVYKQATDKFQIF